MPMNIAKTDDLFCILHYLVCMFELINKDLLCRLQKYRYQLI